jgi:hypothetical protein
MVVEVLSIGIMVVQAFDSASFLHGVAVETRFLQESLSYDRGVGDHAASHAPLLSPKTGKQGAQTSAGPCRAA